MSNPFWEIDGLVLIEDPSEVFLIVGIGAVALVAWLWWKRKRETAPGLTAEQIAQKLGVQAMGAAAPMTLFVIITLVFGLVVFYFSEALNLWWVLLIPGTPSIYYFLYAIKLGANLLSIPNYFEATNLYRKNPKKYAIEALDDPWVKKQLSFYSPQIVKVFLAIATTVR
jgi:hypothetical protein